MMSDRKKTEATANIDKFCLKDYFWTLTVQALSNGLPPPKLDFFFNGYRAFCLQAEGSELLLLDFEDLAEPGAQSKRDFDFEIEDDESLASTGSVFMREFPGRPDSIDAAIAAVCQYFDAIGDWHQTVHSVPYDAQKCDRVPKLNATVSVPTIHYDCEQYQIQRRYRDVHAARGASMHCLSRQSDACAEWELLGHLTVNWLRAVDFTLNKVLAKRQLK